MSYPIRIKAGEMINLIASVLIIVVSLGCLTVVVFPEKSEAIAAGLTDLTNGVKGILPVANGGFGNASAVISSSPSIAASSVTATTSFNLGTKLSTSVTNPYISSGFGYSTSAVLANANGTAAFEIPVSGITSASGVVVLPTANTGWACHTFNEVHTASSVAVVQIASTASSVTFNNYNSSQVSDSFPASSVIHASCFGY